ncbi:MAG: redox-sensing transcriptional repressor Rex [Spirochaetales bacterium]|nr:redox-sensing transcriptional repressor Rex [Spirochaetales bacterium]
MLKANSRVSPFVVERLTKYYMYLRMISSSTTGQWISSKEIAAALELTSSTVRQDISYLSEYKGISKRGYHINDLVSTLEAVIGISTPCSAVIIGAGNFGRALLLHQEFRKQGFVITSIFDANPQLIGTKIDDYTIQCISELSAVIQKQAITVGIVAVPAEAAQDVADKLVTAGVTGILNLSVTMLHVPEYVALVNSRIIIDLMKLSFQITSIKNNGNNILSADEGRSYGN